MPRDTTPGKPTTRRYSPEERAAAVRMVRRMRAELGTVHGTVQRVAIQLGYGTESVRSWTRHADIDEGHVPGVSTSDAATMKALEQENRELKRADEILKRAASFFGAELDRSTRSSRVHRRQPRRGRRGPMGRRLGVELICRVLQVAPSSDYEVKNRQPSARAQRDEVIGPVVHQLWQDNYRVYGARKVLRTARRCGHDVGRDQVARLMRSAGIEGVRRSKRVRTTRPDPGVPRHPTWCAATSPRPLRTSCGSPI